MKKPLDLVGQHYGRLTATDRLPNGKWLCRCSCGNTTEVSIGQLRRQNKNTRSCGCLRKEISKQSCIKHIISEKFGRLVVLEKSHQNKHRKYVWKCLCSCGNILYATTGDLTSGNTKSCGCYMRDRASEANITHGLSKTTEYQRGISRKRRARNKAVVNNWSLEMELFLRKIVDTCAVCGMTNKENIERYSENLSLDHILPLSAGYGLSLDNTCLLCKGCNSTKSNKLLDKLPLDISIKIVKQSVEFQLAWKDQ